MAQTNFSNLVCELSFLLFLTFHFVQSSNDFEGLCRTLSDISKEGRGEIRIKSHYNYVQGCDLLPDNGAWIVTFLFNNFICEDRTWYIAVGSIYMCGDSVRFTRWFGRDSKPRDIKIALQNDKQDATLIYGRAHHEYQNYAPNFAPSVPTRDSRCPSNEIKYYNEQTVISYNFKSRIKVYQLACQFAFKGLWLVRLHFRTHNDSECKRPSFYLNKLATVVTGNGSIVTEIQEPKISFLAETGCFINFTLTLVQNGYNQQLFEAKKIALENKNKTEYKDGCPLSFTRDVLSNKCYSRPSKTVLNYKEAKDWCERQGGELPTVKSLEDLKYFIKRAPVIERFFKYWLGAIRVGRIRNIFVWEKDHSIVNITNWKEGEPNNLGGSQYPEDRIQVYMGNSSEIRGKWNDISHRQISYAICQTEVQEEPMQDSYREPVTNSVTRPNIEYLEYSPAGNSRGGQISDGRFSAGESHTPNKKALIVTACVVMLLLTAIGLFLILARRQNTRNKPNLSLADAYDNPNIDKSLTIETVSGKAEKSYGGLLGYNETTDMKQPIIDFAEADLEDINNI